MKALRCMTILFFMFPFAIVLTLAPRAWGQQPGGTRQYEDPSGLFKITIPEDWKVQRIEESTQFGSPDETSLLMIIAVPVGPPADAKLSPDEAIAVVSPPFFSGSRKALEDKDRYEGLKVDPMKKEEFQGHPCLRQDFRYRRKASPSPRESSAFFFFAGDITMFITVAGAIDGVKTARSCMKTLTVGNAKAPPNSGPFMDMDSLMRGAMGRPDEVRKAIAGLEAKWKAVPTDLKVMKDLHEAYVKMMLHYTEGELKGEKDANAISLEYLEKIRPLRVSIATESLRTMKIPVHVTKPDTRAKGASRSSTAWPVSSISRSRGPFSCRSSGTSRTVSPATPSTGWRKPTLARSSIATVRRSCCGSRSDSSPSWEGISRKHARTRIQPRRPPGRRTLPRRNAGSATRFRRLWKSLPRKTSNAEDYIPSAADRFLA